MYDLEPIKEQLNRIKPDLIWSTVNVETTFERAYVLAAREIGIPVVNSVLSFDNLTRKPALLVYDHYLVWNQKMQDQLLRLYPQVSLDKVTITGTTQFDFHRRPQFMWSRPKTLEQLGLPANSNFFLYTTATKRLAPAEPDLVYRLAHLMQSEDLLKKYWLVVRIHPLDDISRWKDIVGWTEHLVLSEPWNLSPDNERWTFLTREDQARLVSSIAHSAGCLNIASTTALDAAILDKPVIGIRFDNEKDAPQEIIYAAYDSDHYRPLVESGGLRVAHTWSELQFLMQQAIESPELDRDKRAHMVAQECGIVDGKAVDRVTDALLNYFELINVSLENKTPHKQDN
jgi:hypothetical protein